MMGAALVFSKHLGLPNIAYLLICLMPIEIVVFYCVASKKRELSGAEIKPHSRTFLFFAQSFVFGIALLLYANANADYFQRQHDAVLAVAIIFFELAALVYYYFERLCCTKKEEDENPEGGLSVENIHKIDEKGWAKPQQKYEEKITLQIDGKEQEGYQQHGITRGV
jgi:hypothetical protein